MTFQPLHSPSPYTNNGPVMSGESSGAGSSLDRFRVLITKIGNALGFIRMVSDLLHTLSDRHIAVYQTQSYWFPMVHDPLVA